MQFRWPVLGSPEQPMGDVQEGWAAVALDGNAQLGIAAAVLEVSEGDCRSLLTDHRIAPARETSRAVKVDARRAGEVVGLIERHGGVAVGVLGGEVVARHR